MKWLLSPHNDDAVLFASFTILREQALVLTVFDSHKQGGNAAQRQAEDEQAIAILGSVVGFVGLSDLSPDPARVEAELKTLFKEQPEVVYAPAIEDGGHPHHNMIGEIAARIFDNVVFYMTYTTAGKSIGKRVPCEPGWALKKLQALACYESQITRKDNVEHFLREQHEYYQ